jgi:hypothetical protein
MEISPEQMNQALADLRAEIIKLIDRHLAIHEIQSNHLADLERRLQVIEKRQKRRIWKW